MVWHFYGKTKTAITSSKNQFRPQFWAQIVAGVETHPYSLFLGPGGHFWQSYEENQVQKNFCRDLPYDFEKSEIDICTRIFDFAKRTVGFRPLCWLELLWSAQISFITSRGKIFWAFDNGTLRNTKVTVDFLKIHHRAPYKLLRRARCRLELAPPDLGTRIAVTLSIFIFRYWFFITHCVELPDASF